MRVYHRHWFWIWFGDPRSFALVALLGAFVAWFIVPIPRRALAAAGGGAVPAAWLWWGGAAAGALLAIWLAGRLGEHRRRVEIDERAQVVRFRGFMRWEPWWRPRFGAFEVPFSAIQLCEIIRGTARTGPHAAWHRVVAGRAVVDIPPGMTRGGELPDLLRVLASLNPPPPERMTQRGAERVLMRTLWVLWGLGLVGAAGLVLAGP